MKDYIAIINNQENHPIEIRAKNAAEARKKAREYMANVVGWCRYDGTYNLKVRLA